MISLLGGLKRFLVDVLISVATGFFSFIPPVASNQLKKMRLRGFWGGYMGKPVNIIITEYNLPNNDSLPIQIALSAGLETPLITRGMGGAMTHIIDFCSQNISKNIQLTGGNESVGLDNLIILGTPLANSISSKSNS